ncbi:cadherin domain-containing protein [Cylindrospermopsis curvispora]|uniref:Cadherin domain-containing protein n=1 Tax=Cylindrospermopsis curvispora GIHE-G1 TaxID=2666332 RepID=A0A7H0F1M6_9CYAN|nr:cadherin domain-containing protein [Cylindrospermopsis curvispora]QNP29942.1 cadherin domain-containing protein [Cylindrospermopsis curvispora GIHE-G1]
MTISIIIPVYNGQDYLANAVDSILHQTHEDWKLLGVGTLVGLLSSTDPDASPQSFTYTLVSGTGGVDVDNSSFVIVGEQLRLSVSPDFETKSNYRINVRTTDQGGLSRDQAFTINIRDLRESLNDQITQEESSINSFILPVVGSSGAVSYQLLSLDSTPRPDWISFNPSTRQVSGTPPTNFAEAVQLRLNELDSGNNLLGSYNFKLVVQNVNDAPTTASTSRTGQEDTDITLQLSDFAFTDVDSGDSLKAVQIVAPPTAGSLLLNGNPVTYPLQVTREQISQGALRFRPAANANGPYATFQFRVLDQGDGVSSPATFTINLTAVNDPATGQPGITGTLEEGQTLTVNTGGIGDVDGLPASGFSYQWFRASVDGSSNPGLFQEITGITTPTYQLAATDINKVIRVQVSFTDQGGNLESVISNPTNLIQNRPDTPTWSGQQITGTPTQGQTLTVNTGGIGDLDGLGSFSYQWQQSSDNSVWTAISGATGTSLRLGQDQVGKLVRNLVSFTDGYGNRETLTSNPTTQVANINDPASGTPQIIGTPAKGQVLSVSTQGLSDADGIDTSTFSYQWQQSSDGNTWSDISGGTGSNLTLGDSQVNNRVRVRVSYRDYPGGPETQRTLETRESGATALVSNSNLNPVEGAVVLTLNGNPLTGSPSQNQIVVANTSGIRDGDGIGALSYEWLADGQVISGATGDRLTLGQPQVGKAIAVRVRYIDGGGTNEEISSPATPPVLNVNDPALALILTGAIVQNQTLTAQLDSITDLDGAPAIQRDSQGNITNYTFQWQQSSDGTTWSNIPNATTARLNLTETLVSQRLRVTMSFTDNGGFSETVTSVATNPILNVNDAPLGDPTIGVTVPNQGQTLTANTNGISDIDGLGTFNYQWQRLNDTTWEAITGANAATYNPSQRDVNRSLRVRVTYTDGRGTQETLFSTATGLVIDLPDGPTGQPTISGTLTQGELLTADPSSIADLDGFGTFSYQWQQSTDGTTWNNIPNATGNTYRLTQNQVGRQVRVRVNYIDGLGTRETVTSTATTPILNVNDAPTGSVTVRGTPAIGVTLSADTRSLVDPDDEVNSVRAFSYQWFANGVSITGATNATYTPIDDDLNKTLTVQVTYTDQRGTVERVLSPNSLAVISADQLLTGDVSILSTNALEGVDASGNLIAQENVTLVADPWTTQITFNGIRRVQFSYQWYADGVAIIGANSDLFTPGDDHVGKVITVAVTPTGLSSSLLSKGTAPVVNVNDQPEGIPTFSGLVNGAAQEDSTLTVNVSGISDADGIDATTPFSFQWQQSTDSNNWNNITNATGRSFTPGDAQSGQRLRLVTTYTDLRGTTEIVPTPVGSLNNIPGQVRPVNDLPTGSIGINGFLVVGQVLTAASTLVDADGIPPSGVTYTWQRQNPATTSVRGTVGEWSDIATGATYTIADTVSGSPLRVVARYTDQQGFSETITSSPTTNVIRNAREGVVITWFSAQPATSQWQVFSSSTGWQDLAGETRASLQTKNDLGGRQVRLLLNGTPTPALFIQTVDNGVGTVSPITIAPESSQPSFVLGATLKTGSVVGDLDGLDPNSTNVIYQWQRSNNDSSWNNILKDGDKAIYVVTDEDLNQNLRVQITYTDLQGFTSTIYSAATSVIQTAPPPVASGSFDAMTSNGDDIASVEEFPVNNDTSSLAGGLTLTGTVTSPNTSVTLTFGGQTRVARLAVDTDGNRISDASTSTTSPVAWSYTLTAADLTWLVGNEDNQVTARFTRTEGNQIGIGKTSRTLFISQGVLADRTAPTVIDASQPGGLTADVLRNLQALGVEFQGVDTSQPNALVFTYGTADEFNAGADTADKGTGAGLNTSTGTIQGVEQFETGQDGTYTIPGSDGSSTPISAPPRSSFTPVADPLAMTVSGVRPGATVTTQFYLPANVASRLAANDTPLTRWTYYKLDSTDNQFKAFTDNNGNDLYAFRVEGGNNDNLWQTGEQVVLTLTLTDGDKWDRDGLANGIIVDPGLAGLSVNQAPTITSPATTNFAENGTGTAYTVLATDPDAGTTLTYSLLGTDAARFNINSTTGAVTFKTAPNFEVPGDGGGNNIYDITVSASDGSLSASQAVAITVTNVNEAPTITSSATASFAENGTGTAYTVLATDPDAGATLTYSLLGTDAPLFNINSSTGAVTFKTAPNFEVPGDGGGNNIYDITVSASDGSLSTSQAVAITVTNVNEAPTDLTLSATTIAENQAIGTVVGNFSTTDPDAGNSFTYSLVTGAGATDNSFFTIDGGQLKTAAAFDFETKNSYSIRVRTADQGGLSFEKQLTINVTNVNEAPSFTNTTATFPVAENGTTVGTIDPATDPDGGDILNYTLSGADATKFNFNTITRALSFKTPPDFEAKGSAAGTNAYSVTVTATDVRGLNATQTVTVNVTDVVEIGNPPVITSSSNFSVAENSTTVGNITATDADGDPLTYSISGGTDQSLFTINANTGNLSFVAAPNFEAPGDGGINNVYNLRIGVTDGKNTVNQDLIINVTNINEAPTDLTLSATTIAENQAIGTLVGNLSTTDPDAGNTFTYSLVTGAGPTDNSFFTIDGGQLKTAAAFDFENKNSYSIRVRSTDQGGQFFEKQLTINVTNINEAPTDLTLSATTIAENQAIGTVVGNLSTTDPDAGNTFTYSLVTGTGSIDNSSFTIDGGQLKTAAAFDFETKNTYNIRVRSTDQGGLFFEKQLTIGVKDVNEPPVFSAVSFPVRENSKLVGRISVQNPEPEDVITFALAGVDAKLLSIDSQGNLTFNKAPDFEKPEDAGKNNIYQVQVTVGDGNTPPVTQDIDIKVEDVNEAPAAIGDFLAIVGDTSGSIEPLKNDTDPDSGDKLKIIGVTDGKQGKVEIIGDQLKYTLLDAAYTGDDVFSYTISDQGNLTATANVKVNVTGTKVVVNSGVITDVQPGDPLIPSEAGSLSGIVNNVSFNFRAGYNPTQARDILQRTLVSTDAAFNNLFGLYEIDNATGAVNGIAPGQPGYARAALNRAVSSFAVRAGGSGNGITGNVVVGGDKFYAPFVIANGGNLFGSMQDAINTFFQLNADNSRATAENYTSFPVAYFSFGAANPDGAAHIKSFGNNIFGFEDLPAGVGVNDYDFNDTVFSFG